MEVINMKKFIKTMYQTPKLLFRKATSPSNILFIESKFIILFLYLRKINPSVVKIGDICFGFTGLFVRILRFKKEMGPMSIICNCIFTSNPRYVTQECLI